MKAWDWYGNSKGNTVQQLGDGGYIIGADAAESTYRVAPVLVRTDSHGDTLWTRMLHYKDGGFGCQTADGNFVIVSDTIDALRGETYVAATKVGKYGEVMWSSFYPPSGDLPRSVWPTADGGVVVCGKFTDHAGRGIGLKKLDELGNQLWEKVLYPSSDTTASSGHSVEQTSDGGYILAGRLDDPENNRPLLVRADTTGDTIWTWSVVADMPCFSVSQTSDGGFVATGTEHDSVRERASTYLLRFDAAGRLLWHRGYGWGTGHFLGRCVRQTRDGGFVVAGRCEVGSSSGVGAMLFRTDSLGDSMWLREFAYPGGSSNIFHWVEQTADGGFVMTGEVDYTLVLLVKTDSLGLVHGAEVKEKLPLAHRRRPAATLSSRVLRLPGRLGADLLDIAGRRVLSLNPGMNDIQQTPPGVYFLWTADGGASRLVILR